MGGNRLRGGFGAEHLGEVEGRIVQQAFFSVLPDEAQAAQVGAGRVLRVGVGRVLRVGVGRVLRVGVGRGGGLRVSGHQVVQDVLLKR
ncbi:hypothetical protein [Streptomyces sp. NPDC006012]|uniref:hypothetical protein n=1 Tax=Streptomyces sp. NPDC006012 TaxID=3364739 RepID=UPI0036774E64